MVWTNQHPVRKTNTSSYKHVLGVTTVASDAGEHRSWFLVGVLDEKVTFMSMFSM